MRSRLLVYCGLLYVVFCWGLNTVLIKGALAHVSPMGFTALRFLLMTPLAFGLAAVRGERIHIARADLPLLIACAAGGYGVYQYFWIIGLSHTTAFASALLGSSTPIITLGILAVTGLERVRSGRWFGAAVALLGVAIYEGAFSGHAVVRIGDALTLLAACTFAGYTVLSSRLLDRYTPVALLAITMAMGTLMILPVGVPAMLHTDFSHLGAPFWGTFAFAVFFPIVLTYPVWSYGITVLGASRVALFAFLMPVIAGIASVPILHAQFAAYQVIGAAVCLGGLIFASPLGRVSLVELWTQRVAAIRRGGSPRADAAGRRNEAPALVCVADPAISRLAGAAALQSRGTRVVRSALLLLVPVALGRRYDAPVVYGRDRHAVER